MVLMEAITSCCIAFPTRWKAGETFSGAFRKLREMEVRIWGCFLKLWEVKVSFHQCFRKRREVGEDSYKRFPVGIVAITMFHRWLRTLWEGTWKMCGEANGSLAWGLLFLGSTINRLPARSHFGTLRFYILR